MKKDTGIFVFCMNHDRGSVHLSSKWPHDPGTTLGMSGTKLYLHWLVLPHFYSMFVLKFYALFGMIWSETLQNFSILINDHCIFILRHFAYKGFIGTSSFRERETCVSLPWCTRLRSWREGPELLHSKHLSDD